MSSEKKDISVNYIPRSWICVQIYNLGLFHNIVCVLTLFWITQESLISAHVRMFNFFTEVPVFLGLTV